MIGFRLSYQVRQNQESQDTMAFSAVMEQLGGGIVYGPSKERAAGGAPSGIVSMIGTRDADGQLVERCLAGDGAAWEDLVRLHTRRVYTICYRFTGSHADAQDLTQAVFLRVFKTLARFRSAAG